MEFLKRLSGSKEKPDIEKPNSRFIFLGAPEAEAEVSFGSRMALARAFSDFLGVTPQLSSEKFIISGRKGCGKTAIAEWYHFSAQNESNVFVDFVHKSDIDLEKILQIAVAIDSSIEERTIFEWIILVRICELLTHNIAVQDSPGYDYLKKFLARNRGLVDLKDYELKSVVTTQNGEIAIELFARAFSAITGSRLEMHKERAPFYRLIPYLNQAVCSMLGAKENTAYGTQYLLIFDDLDVGLNSKDEKALKTVASLLRTCRDYNIQQFGKKGLHAKILILLRHDIAAAVKKVDGDVAKILESYDVELNWYDHVIYEEDENKSKIKQFISRRIELSFADAGFKIIDQNPWDALVEKTSYWGSKTSFKYVLDHTFYRPRDLLLFFKDVEKLNLRLPIIKHDLDNQIVPKYCQRLMSELKNEMLFRYPREMVDRLMESLRPMASRFEGFSFQEIESAFNKNGITSEIDEIVETLFDYSIIGHIEDGKYFFRHRENPHNPIRCDFGRQFIVHRGVAKFFTLAPLGN